MKKIIVSFSAVTAMLVCCLFGFNTFAAESLEAAVVTPEKSSYTYTGEEIKPSVKVELGGVEIPSNAYDVSYSENINAGTANITVTGKGAYTGTASASFSITPLSISNKSITFENANKAKPSTAPKYKVTFNDKTLKNGKDYTFTVKNGTVTGKNAASVTFTGQGNFKGTKTVKCTVYPEKASGLSADNRKNTSLTLNWKSQKDYKVTGYKVYKCNSSGGSAKLYKTVSANSAYISGLKAGSTNYFKVRAYTKSGDTNYYGAYSTVLKVVTKPYKITVNSVAKSKNKKQLVVRWNSVNCLGYQIQYTTDKNFKKGIKTVNITGSSKSVYKANIPSSNTKYYARVKAFTKDSNYYFGANSAVISSEFSKLYSSYSTYLTGSANRRSNIKNACKRINGTVLKPGETFSFDKVVGKRTKARGFKEAPVFTENHGHGMGLGGGVCQVGTTLFNAALVGNLKIVERQQHSQKVGYIQAGRDAAIDWGSKNVRFKNNTNYPLKIKMYVKNNRVYCKIYVSADVSPKKTSISVTKSGGTYTLKRKVNGKVNYTTKSNYN